MSRTPGNRTPGNRTPAKKKRDVAGEALAEGMRLVRANPALAAVEFSVCRDEKCETAPRDGLVRVSSSGTLPAHPTRVAEPAVWAWSIAHAVLHLGFGHVPAAKGVREQPDRYDIAARWRRDGLPAAYEHCGTAGGEPDQLLVAWRGWYNQPRTTGWRSPPR